ncbi:hypothetical protein HF325_000324 [Metschnikowia pulcherrima]|uniref:Plasma membrane fusion protein PRM1 n=1 Tax=Metschnikowia pulcherrima TaxID=27326 RepID=A0A8H7GY40_9ASCO|nr:hypothetical protein HF325_000324 [Metschnikowia pulcherrima]
MRHYLNLAETLLQAWLDQTVLFMALLTLKVYFFSSALISAISLLSEASLPLCRRLESLASEMEKAPEQMSRLTSLVVKTMAQNVHVLVAKLVYLAAAVAKSIVSLLLELYLGTLTCLITALVKGTLELVSDILEDITNAVQTAINAVLKEFNLALSGLSSVINTVTTAVNAVESLFTSSDKSSVSNNINNVNLTVASLTSISIPTTWIGDIEELADEVPDFEDVLSNRIFANTTFNFTLADSGLTQNTSKLMQAPKFAATLINVKKLAVSTHELGNTTTQSVCDDVEVVLKEAVLVTQACADYIILGLCVGTVVYAVIAWILAYFRIRKRARLFTSLAEINDSTEAGNAVGQYEHGFMAIFTGRWSPQMQWLYSFVASPNLRTCLFFGILGWSMWLNFGEYLDNTQDSLDDAVDEVNQALFSSIHNTTSLILSEIDNFQTSVNDTINGVFGTSFLAKPLRTIIYCTIGRKIDTIEQGLEWIERNTVFEAPTMNKTEMQAIFSNLAQDVSQTQLGIAGNIVSAVQSIIQAQKSALWKEFFIATAFVAVWAVYLAIGLLLLAYQKGSDPTTPNVTSDQRAAAHVISWPSQLDAEAHRAYNYPYKDPYGAVYPPAQDETESSLSKTLEMGLASRERDERLNSLALSSHRNNIR